MTLQESKNKESEKRGYTNFEALLNYCFSIQDPSLAFEVLEESAIQAIDSAREEATLKDAIKILNRIAPTATPKEYKYLSEAVAALELIRDGHLRN